MISVSYVRSDRMKNSAKGNMTNPGMVQGSRSHKQFTGRATILQTPRGQTGSLQSSALVDQLSAGTRNDLGSGAREDATGATRKQDFRNVICEAKL
jgi:hypothetical protein